MKFRSSPSEREHLLERALRLYTGDYVADRVLRLGPAAFALGVDGIPLTAMCVELVPSSAVKAFRGELQGFFSEYLSTISNAAVEEGGMLDSFLGEVVIACWGLDGKPGREEKACRAAQKIRWGMKGLLKKFDLDAALGIGISSGNAHVGNVGSEQRLKFSVIGDVPNAASRLAVVGLETSRMVVLDATTASGLRGDLRALVHPFARSLPAATSSPHFYLAE